MKCFIAIALLSLCAVAYAADSCHDNVAAACGQHRSTLLSGINDCNSRYGAGIQNIEQDFGPYVNLHLNKSYEYLLMATYFNSYLKNRPGFQKMYQGLSDRAFDDTIKLIKQISRRGGKVDLNRLHYEVDHFKTPKLNLEMNELNSLALALDNEKHLAHSTFHMHGLVSHSNHHDPEMTQYFEEEFVSKQADSVRKLSGYANDLSKMVHNPDPSLSIYLFDEFLAKQ